VDTNGEYGEDTELAAFSPIYNIWILIYYINDYLNPVTFVKLIEVYSC
jgi:hypothetical protein